MRARVCKRVFLLVMGLTMVMGCKRGADEKPSLANTSRPNIVFIYTDDQTYESIHALGNEEIRTPNMDRLVNNGTTFTHAYNMGGWHGAVCVASRTMMVSGRMIWNAEKFEKFWKRGDSSALEATWGRLMKRQGYDTYMTGKWHVEAPAVYVFDTVRHVRGGMPGDRRNELAGAIALWKDESGDMKDWNKFMPLGYARPLDESDTEWSPSDSLQGGYWEGGRHWSEVVRDDAIDFIDRARTKDTPFFMYLAFNAPHDPRQSPQEYLDMYPVDSIELPDNFMPEYPWKDSIGDEPSLRDEALAPFPRTGYAVRKHRQEYYAIISHLDTQIGAILNALEASGKMDNTYVFFTSDHGLAVGHHGLIGKQSLFDHSFRVPLMAMGPGIPKGKRLSQDVYLQDIMPTSLELAGAPKPEFVQFESFMDLISGSRQESHYEGIYGAYRNLQRAYRKDGYKLLVFPAVPKVLLFDLENDPGELRDIADDPVQAQRVKTMFDELLAWQQRMGDSLDLKPIYDGVRALNGK